MMRNIIILILSLNLYGADAMLHISKSNKKKNFYEIQLASFLSLEDAKNFYFKIPIKFQYDSNIYKLSKYFTVRYGSAREEKSSLLNELKELKESFKDAYLIRINSSTLNKKVTFRDKENKNDSRENAKVDSKKIATKLKYKSKPKKIYSIKDNYEYSDLLIKADKLQNSNDLIESIEIYESLVKYKRDDLIENNLFYLYGKTNNWEKVREEILHRDNVSSLLYSYAIGAIEANNQTLEKELKPFLNRDYRGYLNLILGVFFEKKGFTYQAYEYYKSAYLKNSNDSYLTYSYARGCELVELYKLAKELYESLFQNENIPENIRQNSYIRYVELSNFLM